MIALVQIERVPAPAEICVDLASLIHSLALALLVVTIDAAHYLYSAVLTRNTATFTSAYFPPFILQMVFW